MSQDQFEYRSFSPNRDIPRLMSLYAAVDNIDQEGNQVSEDILRQQLSLPGHDPLKDRWVVDEPGDGSFMIGSALLRADSQSSSVSANIIVHPVWRHRGVGSGLLSMVKQRALQLGGRSLEIYASAKHPAAQGFLKKHGFTALGAYTELRLAGDVKLPPVIWPYGYTMKPYSEVNNLTTLTEAMNLSYIPLWGHQEVSEEQMSSWLPDFVPHGIFLVFSEKGRVVGISRVEVSPERTQKNGIPTGYIDAPGVVPQHRRLDLYRALVLTGIRWLREHGQDLIEMESWGDKLEVLKMYRELGFKDSHQMICYQLNLVERDGNTGSS